MVRGITILTVSSCLLAAGFLSGCQTSGKAGAAKSAAACPVCGMPLKSVPIKDVTYAKCVCPTCKQVSIIDQMTADAVRAYVGDQVQNTVQVCDNCKALVAQCPACRAKMKK